MSFERYPPSPRFRIGPLQIDLERDTVSGEVGAVGLTSRAEQLLLLLARYPNLLVTREQILDTIWADRVVEDAAITNCIWQIRKAIGERGKEILQTRAKRGYVLVVAESDWIIDAPTSVQAASTDVEALHASARPSDVFTGDSGGHNAAKIDDVSESGASSPAHHQVAPHVGPRRWPWGLSWRSVAMLAVVALVCAGLALRFLRATPDRIDLRPDVETTVAVLAPDKMDWLREAVLRSVIENLYLHGGRVVLFQKAQTRNPFAGPHLQVQVTHATSAEIEAELSLVQGRAAVREHYRGPANGLAPAVQALLTRTFGEAGRQLTPAMDVLVSGWAAEQRFDHLQAIEDFRRAMARDPAANDAKLALASALLEQGQGKAAQALVDQLLAGPPLDAGQRCTLDEMLAEIAPERMSAQPCDRAERIARLGKLEMRELLRDIQASKGPKSPQQWLYDETAAIFAHIRLGEADQAEARLVRAQRTAAEVGWEHARIELGTLRGTSAIHNGQTERGADLQLDSANALEALGDVRSALRERTIGLRKIPIVPGRAIDARRTQVRAIVDRARAIGSVRAEIEALYLLARLDRGRLDEWRVELARILELLEEAYPQQQQTRDLHFVLNEMEVQHRYGDVLDGVMRIERAGGTQPQAQLWNLTLRAESHFARDELDQAVNAVDAMQRENFEIQDTNPCLFAWLFVEAQQPQRAREILGVCRSQRYDRASQASRADPALVAEARLYQRNGEADRAWPVLLPRIEALIATKDLTLREAESLALLARHAVGLPGADRARLQQALDIVEAMARLDGAGVELQAGAHLLRWRLCATATAGECGPVLSPSAPEDHLEERLAKQAAAG